MWEFSLWFQDWLSEQHVRLIIKTLTLIFYNIIIYQTSEACWSDNESELTESGPPSEADTSVSASPEDVTAEQLRLMYQLPDEEPRQPGRCRGCSALKRRSGPSVGHWPGSAGAPARQQWRRLTLRRRVHRERESCCCGVRRDDGQRK